MSALSIPSLRIFLTGATGVVGRRVIPLLLERGHTVTAVGRSDAKRDLLRRIGATPVALDMFDAQAARQAVEGHDVVINLATHIPPTAFKMMLPWEWKENDRVRKLGAATLATAASDAGVPRLIQESFAPIYEDAGDAWIDEGWRMRPVKYNKTVLDAERAANEFTQRGGTGVVLRFAAFYGPDATQMHAYVRSMRSGWMPLPGSPNAFISSISHDDAATAVVAALTVPAGTYNVTDDEPLRRREWGSSLAHTLRVEPPKALPQWLTQLGGSGMELFGRSERISNKKFREASGWAPQFRSVREGWKWAAAPFAATGNVR